MAVTQSNSDRIQQSTTTQRQYQQALARFADQPRLNTRYGKFWDIGYVKYYQKSLFLINTYAKSSVITSNTA
jgi:hypothetical protein